MIRLEERLQTILQQQQENPRNYTDDGCSEDCVLQWVASLQPFPNNLGGIRPVVRFMEMSWTNVLSTCIDVATRGGMIGKGSDHHHRNNYSN
jgi:hypothetical protein